MNSQDGLDSAAVTNIPQSQWFKQEKLILLTLHANVGLTGDWPFSVSLLCQDPGSQNSHEDTARL